jgi:hypothetical protein
VKRLLHREKRKEKRVKSKGQRVTGCELRVKSMAPQWNILQIPPQYDLLDLRGWQGKHGAERCAFWVQGSPVKFAALLFCEKFNPDGINRKINSIGQAGQAGFWDNK